MGINMLGIVICLIVALFIFCIFAGEELRNKEKISWLGWTVFLLLLIITIGCLVICKHEIERNTVIEVIINEKYKVEAFVQNDTTYFVKNIKDENIY